VTGKFGKLNVCMATEAVGNSRLSISHLVHNWNQSILFTCWVNSPRANYRSNTKYVGYT